MRSVTNTRDNRNVLGFGQDRVVVKVDAGTGCKPAHAMHAGSPHLLASLALGLTTTRATAARLLSPARLWECASRILAAISPQPAMCQRMAYRSRPVRIPSY